MYIFELTFLIMKTIYCYDKNTKT